MPRVPVSSSRARKAPRLALVARRAANAVTKAKPKASSRTAPGAKRKLAIVPRTKAAPAKAKVKAKVKRVAAIQPGEATRVPARGAAAKRPPLALVPRPEVVRPFEPVARVPRERLLERYTPLIKYVVERLSVGLPKNVDHDDLMSAGILGLLDAYDKFDENKGTKFETYAVWRIKGAVLDQLRALDWASRSVRRKAREVEVSTRRLDQRLGRAATDVEVAKEAKMTLADYHRLMDQVRGAVLLSLDETRSPEDGDSLGLAEVIEDPNAPDVLARLEEEETRIVLLDTLNRLPEQERIVVALYYYEHMTLREIGVTLGISESRVSQVHSRAVLRLKSRVRRALAA